MKKLTFQVKPAVRSKPPKTAVRSTPELRYLTKIYWSEDDEGFIAEAPALRGCAGFGRTAAEALDDFAKAAALWIESARKHDDPIPEPDAARDAISEVLPFLNLSKLGRTAGINKFTLASKLRRQTKFTAEEAKAILNALTPHGHPA